MPPGQEEEIRYMFLRLDDGVRDVNDAVTVQSDMLHEDLEHIGGVLEEIKELLTERR